MHTSTGLVDEELELKQLALEKVRRMDLHFSEDLGRRVADLIVEVEAENEGIDRDLQMVASLQIDEARQASSLLNATQPMTEKLISSFDSLASLLASERQDISDFQLLRKVHQTLETTKAVASINANLLHLMQHSVEITQMLEGNGSVLCVYEKLRPIHLFKKEVMQAKSPDSRFNPHFELFLGVLQQLGKRVRSILQRSASVAREVQQLEKAGSSEWEEFLDKEISHLRDCIYIYLIDCEANVLPDNPGIFQTSDQAVLKEKGLWGLITHWLGEGVARTWREVMEVYADETEDDVADKLDVQTVMNRMSDVVRVLDMYVFCLIKDGNNCPTPETYASGVWGDMARALEVAAVVSLKVHEMVTKMLNVYTDRVSSGERKKRLPTPDLLKLIKWTKVYENALVNRCLGQLVENPSIVSLTDRIQTELGNSRTVLLRLAGQRLKEWLCEMAATQAKGICDGISSGTEEMFCEDGKYATVGPIDLFDMYQKQFTDLAPHQDVKVMDCLATAMQLSSRIYIGVIKESSPLQWWEDRCLQEHIKLSEGEWMDLRLKMLCAFANDMTRCHEEVDVMRKKFQKFMPSDWHEVALKEMAQDFLAAQYSMVVWISEHVMLECNANGTISNMFSRPMQEERCMHHSPTSLMGSDPGVQQELGDVLATVKDFEADLRAALHPDRFQQMLDALLGFVVTEYLQKLTARLDGSTGGKKFELNASHGSLLKRDAEAMHYDFEGAHGADIARDAILRIAKLIEVDSGRSFGLVAEATLRVFPDFPSHLGRLLVEKRADLSDKEKEAALERWDHLIGLQNRNENDQPQEVANGQRPSTILGEVRVVVKAGIKAKLDKLGGVIGLFRGSKPAPQQQPAQARSPSLHPPPPPPP
eukprot:Sspe_Gene.100926::Locus_75567_Transcript_1_1_Confidence_1.000_Length_2682::g.100926::m.100926